MDTPERRKGARSFADLDPEIVEQLNAGTLEAASLSESLAVDFAALTRVAFPDLPESAHREVEAATSLGIIRRMQAMGNILYGALGEAGFERVCTHASDTVRGWGCYMVATPPKMKLKARLNLIRPLADDPHYSVREWSFIAVRRHFIMNVGHAVELLVPWTAAKNTLNVRRFAVEAIRPCGVWTVHLEQMKQNPDLGLPVLEPMRAIGERYAQLSVANFINDASKTRRTWAESLAERWLIESPVPETRWILHHALRTIRKSS